MRYWAAFLALLWIAPAAAQEKLVQLYERGYKRIHTEGYLSFDGCEYDKPYKVGPYIFLCQVYWYHYSYGSVKLVARELEYQGKKMLSVYLCVSDDLCMRGELRRL